MKLGKFDIVALSDGFFALDGGQVFGVVPKPLWEKKMPADSRNRVRFALTCLLVRTGKRNILIDTGIGDKYQSKFADIYAVDKTTSDLISDLKICGLAPEDIDIVINTHLHFDHCGWNTRRDGERLVPTFPRARYVIQRGEWEHACSPTEHDRASYIDYCFTPAEAQTDFLEGDREIVPGVNVEVIPGHTRNLQCVRLGSEGQQAYFISDLVPTRFHLPYPWIMSLDQYPVETLASRKRLLPSLARTDALVVFPHDPTTPWATLMEVDGKISTASL